VASKAARAAVAPSVAASRELMSGKLAAARKFPEISSRTALISR
jgi:hypothetical protein